MKEILPLLILIGFSVGCSSIKKQGEAEVILASEIKWEKLNPARGDKSPQAGTLWGDRKGTGMPTGFLVKFVDGFSSPPHIHNETYRGVVIEGLVHNDDPKAEHMWMPQGSYWTQPKGESHITAAKGKRNIAFIEIQSAPYLVKPASMAFDSGERPVNIDASNIVWQKLSRNKNAKISHLWGSPKSDKVSGSLVKLTAGTQTSIQSRAQSLRVVLITGDLKYDNKQYLNPGSYFSSIGQFKHTISCESSSDCTFYIRSKGKYKIR